MINYKLQIADRSFVRYRFRRLQFSFFFAARLSTSVTRLDDLLPFGQLFKASFDNFCGPNPQILGKFWEGINSFLSPCENSLGDFWATFSMTLGNFLMDIGRLFHWHWHWATSFWSPWFQHVAMTSAAKALRRRQTSSNNNNGFLKRPKLTSQSQISSLEESLANFQSSDSFVQIWLTVWPDWAFYCTLGNFFKACGDNYFAHILGNFCKGVKIFHVSNGIIFGQLL